VDKRIGGIHHQPLQERRETLSAQLGIIESKSLKLCLFPTGFYKQQLLGFDEHLPESQAINNPSHLHPSHLSLIFAIVSPFSNT
jgi:hypothetical protein